MKYFSLLLITLVTFSCNSPKNHENDSNFPALSGKYFGQETPGNTPKLFAPNIISTGMAEINSTYSPDYKEFFYSIRMPNRQLVMMQMHYKNNKWTEPKVFEHSGVYSDADPFITYDGKWLYFISRRPIDSKDGVKKDWDIWRCEKENGKWGKPQWLDGDINSHTDETYPSLTRDGKLYFSSGRLDVNNKDIFYAEKLEDAFSKPVRLNDPINSKREGDIFISPDDDYMIFGSFGRKEGSGLFITFKSENEWTIPKLMSQEINMTGYEFCPIVSPDGKYFFFTSSNTLKTKKESHALNYQQMKKDFIKSYQNPQMGKTDIYWVSTEIIDTYR